MELDRELQQKNAELAAKSAHIERLDRENQRLNLAIRLLKVDHRVAEISSVEQEAGNPRPTTRFRFVEVNADGDPIGEPKNVAIEGDLAYVDAWVIKYADEAVERGDPLRSTSVCLFRRIFGEYQEPNEGVAIDPVGSRPTVYSQGKELLPLERDIWTNFWQ